MSMDISVILGQAANLTDLKSDVQAVLREMLNLPFCPIVDIKELKTHQNSLGEVGDTVTFGIDALAEANMMVLDLPHDESDPFSKKPTAVISAGALRTEESWALVIALAIALGKRIKANVIDDSQLLSANPEANPTQLLEMLKLVERQNDLSQASHELLKGLRLV